MFKKKNAKKSSSTVLEEAQREEADYLATLAKLRMRQAGINVASRPVPPPTSAGFRSPPKQQPPPPELPARPSMERQNKLLEQQCLAKHKPQVQKSSRPPPLPPLPPTTRVESMVQKARRGSRMQLKDNNEHIFETPETISCFKEGVYGQNGQINLNDNVAENSNTADTIGSYKEGIYGPNGEINLKDTPGESSSDQFDMDVESFHPHQMQKQSGARDADMNFPLHDEILKDFSGTPGSRKSGISMDSTDISDQRGFRGKLLFQGAQLESALDAEEKETILKWTKEKFPLSEIESRLQEEDDGTYCITDQGFIYILSVKKNLDEVEHFQIRSHINLVTNDVSWAVTTQDFRGMGKTMTVFPTLFDLLGFYKSFKSIDLGFHLREPLEAE
eukprot:m.28637 g.28637  ORF g.28637 m.28637 type:complete len:389 (-) comp8019_c0_seq2:103-1269(-)